MGKIKSKQIKRYSEEMIQKGIEFSEEFDKNKKILGNKMPSKKMRNRIAGHLVRRMKRERTEKEKLK